MRIRVVVAAIALALMVLGGRKAADAALPVIVRWHGEGWQVYLVYNMNPAHPNPKVGRLLGRTKVLDRWPFPRPNGYERLPVNVLTLPKIDRHVAVYVTGGHVHRELLVRRGWRVRPHTPLSRIMNYTGIVPG